MTTLTTHHPASSARSAAISLAVGLSLALIVAGGSVHADEYTQETNHVSIARPTANVLRLCCETTTSDLPAPVAEAMRNCVKVSGTDVQDSRATYSGSGVVLADGYVATAKHVIRDASPIWIDVDGRRYPAQLASAHQTLDLCVLKTAKIPNLTGVKLVSRQVARDETLYFAGYDPRGFRSWKARVLSFAFRDLESGGFVRSGSISGNSGGPGFNAAGELATILYANASMDTYSGAGTTISTEPSATLEFLTSFKTGIRMPGVAVAPQQYQQSPRAVYPRNCPPGRPCPPQPPTDPCISCPPGEQGPAGPVGPVGPPGPPAKIDIDLIVDAVLERLPDVILQPTYDNGSGLVAVGDQIRGRLGEELLIPPSWLQIENQFSDSDLGTTETQIPIGARPGGRLKFDSIGKQNVN